MSHHNIDFNDLIDVKKLSLMKIDKILIKQTL